MENGITLYVDGKPIECSTGNLVLPEQSKATYIGEDQEAVIRILGMNKRLPRKKKKLIRKQMRRWFDFNFIKIHS
jgi:hypothetical protein